MDSRDIEKRKITLDELAHFDEESGIEYWYARELMPSFGYTQWRRFEEAINRAISSSETSKTPGQYHFAKVGKMIKTGKGAKREITDYKLTRYACYLIAMNGDPRKEEIAFTQSYFALQTRKQELIEERMSAISRIEVRDRLTEAEKRLSKNIYERGVDDKGFGRIRSKGDKALFGGYTTSQMKNKLGIPERKPLADHLPAVTIAAKQLATEITNFNVGENDLYGEKKITTEHVQNNSSVRELLGKRGIKPEELPPEKDVKKLKREFERDKKNLEKKSKGFLRSEE